MYRSLKFGRKFAFYQKTSPPHLNFFLLCFVIMLINMLNKNVHFLFYSLTYSLISIGNYHLFSIEGNDPCVTIDSHRQAGKK